MKMQPIGHLLNFLVHTKQLVRDDDASVGLWRSLPQVAPSIYVLFLSFFKEVVKFLVFIQFKK